jgi:hypothetical protein
MGGRVRPEVAVVQGGDANGGVCHDNHCGVELAVPADLSGPKACLRRGRARPASPWRARLLDLQLVPDRTERVALVVADPGGDERGEPLVDGRHERGVEGERVIDGGSFAAGPNRVRAFVGERGGGALVEARLQYSLAFWFCPLLGMNEAQENRLK